MQTPSTKDYDAAMKRLALCEQRLKDLSASNEERNQEIDELKDQVTVLDLKLHKSYQAGDEDRIDELEAELEVLRKAIGRKERIISARDQSIHAEHERQVMLAEVSAYDAWQEALIGYENALVEAALETAGGLLKQAYIVNSAPIGSGGEVFSSNVTRLTDYFGRRIAARLHEYDCELPESPIPLAAPTSELIPEDVRKTFVHSKRKVLHPATDAQFNEELLTA